jgi:hypothetical protein|tara:strand:- start:481 stop:606 length:126 start_codon:yes stop_codon:yes gene_type:complete
MNNKQLIKELEDLQKSVFFLSEKMIKAELGLIIKKLNKGGK